MPWAPWTVFAACMFMVWCVVYVKTTSMRKAMMGALLAGKTFAVVYAVGGLDRPLVTLWLLHRTPAGVVAHPIHVTCCQAIFLAFLASLLVVLVLPAAAEKQPRLKRLLEQQ